jgi:hypothetical protein|nr:MAG TPA: chitin synthase regulator [Caudoviricetes sp.]
MILYIVIIAFLVLFSVYVSYEFRRTKRIRKESTKLDSEVYRRKAKDKNEDIYYEKILKEPHGTE